jgi:hypothetical protein
LIPDAKRKRRSGESFASEKIASGMAFSIGKAVSTKARPKASGRMRESPRLAALKRSHFTKKGRSARISRGLEALERFRWDLDLDRETIRWAAEDPEIEHL